MGDLRRRLGIGIRGEGPVEAGKAPMVLLHAFPVDSRMWRPLQGELERRGIAAHALDYPGFGSTPPWPGVDPSIDAIAEAAVATLADLGAISAHWVGCSMGGYVALAIAEHHPEAVVGIGLVDTRAGADSEEARLARFEDAEKIERLERLTDTEDWAEPLIGVDGVQRADIIDAVADMIASAAPKAVAWGLRAMAGRPDRTSILRGLGVPAVVAWGERDTVGSLEEAEEMAEALGIDVTRVPGTGHLSPFEDPRAVADALASLYVG